MKLLGLSGSLRTGSLNTKLMYEAARVFGEATFVIGAIEMPHYNGDVEETKGPPAEAQALFDQITAADAVVIACPEYNGSLPGVLKNALDWVSRINGAPWAGKPVAIIAAAAGRTGGARGVLALRQTMMAHRPLLLQGPEVLVAGAANEFDENGRLTNPRYIRALETVMQDLRRYAAE